MPGVVSILAGRTSSGSSTTLAYYYFFDWEIEVPSICGRVGIPLEVRADPAPVVSFSASPDTVLLPGSDTVTFTDQTPDVASRLWLFGNGQTGTAAQETVSYAQEGSYRVWLVATTANGCSNVAEKEIIVRKVVSLFDVPGLVARLTLFPNPASEQINLMLEGATIPPDRVEITVFDARGLAVINQSEVELHQGSYHTLDISLLPAGHYAIVVRCKGQVWASAIFARH